MPRSEVDLEWVQNDQRCRCPAERVEREPLELHRAAWEDACVRADTQSTGLRAAGYDLAVSPVRDAAHPRGF